MPLSDAALDLMADELAANATHAELHTDDPGAAGTLNPTTAARQPIAWTAASSGGDIAFSAPEAFTGGAASGPVEWVSLWDALTLGTFLGRYPIVGDQTFNAAGEYTLTNVAINGSSPT